MTAPQQISDRGLTLLKQSEGFSPTIYLCPAGKPTIGYGHVVRAGEHYPPGGIDEAAAEALLKYDVSGAAQAVSRLVTVDLTQRQFDALVVLTYNIGVGAFKYSTLLRCLNGRNIEAAISQWRRWVYADGAVLPGLVARRNAEIALFQES